MSDSNYFCGLQIRNFTTTHLADFEHLNLFPSLKEINQCHHINVGAVSAVKWISIQQKIQKTKMGGKNWIRDWHIVWEKSLDNIHKCSINVRHNIIQFKVIHRLHTILKPDCIKCIQMYPHFLVESWQQKAHCSTPFGLVKIQSYRENIFDFISIEYSENWHPDPHVANLGLEKKSYGFQMQAVFLSMIVAKQIIWQM